MKVFHRVAMTDTVPLLKFATYAVFPFGVNATD